MKIDPEQVVAFLIGSQWYHPTCAPMVDGSQRSTCRPGGGFDQYEYHCESCGKKIDRVRPSDCSVPGSETVCNDKDNT